MTTSIDGRAFRDVLGHLPTGVVAVAALDRSGEPVGMAVGSFGSVSLSPPLVAFYPDKRSTTFPLIRESGRFSVHVLSAEQESLCRAFAVKGGNKFDSIDWRTSDHGTPRIEGAVAWLECEIEAVHEAGDHHLVLGRVLDLGLGVPAVPLVFFQGGYGAFLPASLSSPATAELLGPLKLVDHVRGEMEQLARDLGARCYAHVVRGDDLVVVSVVEGRPGRVVPARVGMRFPLVSPWAESFVAWFDPQSREDWIARQPLAAAEAARLRASMTQVSAAGWSYTVREDDVEGLEVTIELVSRYGHDDVGRSELDRLVRHVGTWGDPDDFDQLPAGAVKSISVPALADDGTLVLMLSVHDLPRSLTPAQLARARTRLHDMADQVAGKHRALA